MLNHLICLVYRTISGSRKTRINILLHHWAEAVPCWCLAVCSRTLPTQPPMCGENDWQHV